MNFFPFAIVLASVIGSLAIPVQKPSTSSSTKCSSKCTGVKSNFNYLPNKSYVYDLESETIVRLVGLNVDENVVVQRATVTISVSDNPCEWAMKLSDVDITGASVSSNWKNELESNPIRFSFDDGLIQNVCPVVDDPIWSVNIKRGILSTLHNALQGDNELTDGHEIDVSGGCPTKYEVKNEMGGRKVYKTKKLVNCRNSHGNHTSIRGVSYDVNSLIQQSPLVDSEQKCRHTIRDDKLIEARCTESHLFKPLDDKDKSGIQSTIVQTLTYKQTLNGPINNSHFYDVSERKTLEFDHSEFEFEQSQEASGLAQNDVKRLCQVSPNTVRSETPGVFTSLVYNLRKMKESELGQLWQSAKLNKRCSKERKFVLDALPMCGSEECVKLMVTLLQSTDLSDGDKHMWYTSFAFVPKVTSDMVKAVLPLVDTHHKGLLGVSSLVHGFCRSNSRCSNNKNVRQFMEKLKQRLGKDCQISGSVEFEEVIYVLKSISNVGHYDSIIPTLQRCFEKESNNIEIRLSAMNALRRMSCEHEDSLDSLWNVYERITADVELRTTAFIQLMRCPHQTKFVDKLQKSINKETVNQVGSFVYSYIKSKRDSNDPTQSHLQSVLQQVRLDRRFNLDPRKYSRFTQIGHFNDIMNLGGQIEQSTVFEPESVMPRNLFANLTVHLFGSSVNLVEFGGRQEGLDKLINSLFGAEGYFTNPNGYEFNTGKSTKRTSRLSTLKDMFKKRSHYQSHNKLALSMFVKVFGDELGYFGFEGNNIMEDIKELMNVQKLLSTLARGKEVKLTKNIMFADSVKTIPTISGFPLRISVNGTASIDADLSLKVDLTKMIKPKPGQPMDLNVTTRFRPSAAVEISSIVAIKIDNMNSGVKMVSRLHTSTAVDTNVQVSDGKLLKVKVTLPQDKMEVIDIHSELYNVADNRALSHGDEHSKTYTTCSSNGFDTIVGLKLCAQLQTTKSPFSLFNGPSRLLLTAEKSDKQLNSYQMEMQWAQQGYPKRFLFNTPGSEVDREVRIEVKHEKTENKLKINFRSPIKRLEFDGQWTSPQPSKGLGTLSLTVDSTDKYELDLTTESRDQSVIYEATCRVPGRQPISFRAEAKCPMRSGGYRMCKEFDLDTKLTGLHDEQIEFNAKYSMNPLNVQVSWKCPASESGVKVFSKSESKNGKESERETIVDISYKRIKTGKTHKIKLNNKMNTKRPEKGSYELTEVTKFECTLLPDINFVGGTDIIVSPKKMLYKSDVKYGKDQKKKLMVRIDGEKKSSHKLEMDVSMQWDSYDINEKGKLILEKDLPTKMLLSIESLNGRTNERRLLSQVRFEQKNGPKIDLETEVKLQYPGRDIRIFYDMDETKKNEYKTKLICQWQAGKQIEIDSNILRKYSKDHYEYMVNSEAKITGKSDPLFFHKYAKVSKTGSKYVGYMKKGDQSLYDVKLELVQRDANDYKMISHVKSGYLGNVDYELNGHLKTINNQYQLLCNVKCDQKQWAKIDIVTPERLIDITNKQLKGELMWDLSTSDPKELMVEYKGQKDTKRHELTLKSQLNGDNYKYNVKIQSGDVYMINNTLTHNNRHVIECGVGFIIDDPLQFDASLQTHHPWTKRHYSGLILLNHKSKGQRRMEVELKCHTNNKRMFMLMDWEKPGKDHKKWIVKGQIGDAGLEMNGNLRMPCDYGKDCDITLDYNNKIYWSSEKKIQHEGFYEWKSADSSLNYWEQLKTPFDVAKQNKFEISFKKVSNKHYMTEFMIEHNNKPKLEVDLSLTGGSATKSVDLKITTDVESLKNINFKVDLDYVKGTKVTTKLTVNQRNEIGATYKHEFDGSKPKVGSALISTNLKVPQHSIDCRVRAEMDYDGVKDKVNGEVNVKLNNDQYKSQVIINGQTGSGIFKLQTPFDQWKTGKIEVTKVGDGEYQIETEKNGQKMGSVKGQIKTTRHSFVFKFEVEQIEKPFAFVVEKTEQDKSRYRMQIILDPVSSEKKVFGVDVTLKRSPHFDWKLRLDADHRYIDVTYLKGQELYQHIPSMNGVRLNWRVEIQPNGHSQRQPTVLTLGPVKVNGDKKTFDMKLTDPELNKPIVVKMMKEIKDVNTEKYSLMLDYSGGEQEKIITAGVLMKNIGLLKPSGNKRLEFLVEHGDTQLHNKLWIEWTDDFYYQSTQYTGLIGVQYKNKINQLRQWEIKFDVPNDKTLRLTLTGTESVYNLEWTIKDSGFEHQIKFTIDDKPMLFVSGILHKTNKNVEFEIRRSEITDVLFHSSVRLVNKDAARISVWHTEKGKRLNDVDVRVELKKQDLLKTKLYIRPGVHREVQFAAQKYFDRFNSGSKWNYKSYGLERPEFMSKLHHHTKPMFTSWEQERIVMSNELGPLMNGVTEQMNTLTEIVNELFWATIDICEQMIDQLIQYIPGGHSIHESYLQLKDKMMRNVGRKVDEMIDYVTEFLNLLTKINGKTEEYKNRVGTFFKNSMSDTLESLSKSGIYTKIIGYFKSLNMDNINAVRDRICLFARNVQSYAGRVQESLSDNAFYSSIVKPWFDVNSVDFGQTIKDFVNDMKTDLMKTYSPHKYIPNVTENNPEEGRYEVLFPLPIKAKSLKYLTKQFHPKTLKRIKQTIQDKIDDLSEQMLNVGQSTGYGVMDSLYQYRPKTLDIVDWIPPFRQHAYLIGNEHIVTFDGKVYDFNANCEYLLASDFQQNKFTITSSFVKDGNMVVLNKITAHLVGSNIQLNTDGTVKIDDVNIELPFHKIDDIQGSLLLSVVRQDHSIVVNTFDDITINCDWYHHICQISLPGTYHGQSAGLLGSNDNEPHNDLYLPDGSMNEEIDVFAQKWHVSGDKCQTKLNSASINKITSDHQMYDECDLHFKDNNSPFRDCFRKVNPTPFMSMCLSDMHRHTIRSSIDRHPQGLCNISAAYLMACNEKMGYDMDVMPTHCVRCDNPIQSGGDMSESDGAMEIDNDDESVDVDVVYVVQESPCMKWIQPKLLQINERITNKLNKQNVHFGVIGYGGQGVHDTPHYHTGNNKINFNKNGLKSAFKSLDFDRISQSESITDTMEALLFATEYPFRAGVLKSVVLITCDGCKGEKVDYYDLQQEFLMRDIKLNMFTLQDIKLDVSDTETIIGFDARQMYTKSGEGKPQLRSHLSQPHDSCTVLTQETNGTVLNIKHSSNLNVESENVGTKLRNQIQYSKCQVCECNNVMSSPKIQCFPCQVPRPVSLTESTFFNLPYIKLQQKLEDWDLV